MGGFSRLAIVNRGEPAMRLIHAVSELNQHRSEPIRTIALFTESEHDAMFVRFADEAVLLGPSLVDDGHGGRRPGYLDHALLERALLRARADAAWVGWGFVAEQPEFVELCDRLGIVFVGPDAAVMRRLGDKIAAKRLAEEAGVPVAPWSGGPVGSAEAALEHAERIGFPVMIKAAAGGGGRGIRRVDHPSALAAAFASARAEALQAFGDGTLLIEKLIAPARHVEVQIVADGCGGVWALGVRDCSYQRRNQKVLEESASPVLSAEHERELADAARRLALLAGYRNAGTVEFLYEPDCNRFSFMEVNARLQVEHPVTEAVTGVDLVKLQLELAAGGRLVGEPPACVGHAIEARLNAEDPALGFAPAPGRIVLLRLPTGPGVRVDTGVAERDVIPAEFDSMIGKVIAWGRDRDEALARLRRAIGHTVTLIEGGATNQGFLLELLDREEVRRGEVDTGWLDRLYLSGEALPPRHGDVALLQAAIECCDADTTVDRARFYAFARRGRPSASSDPVRTYDLRHRGQAYRFTVAHIAPERYRVAVDGLSLEVGARRIGPYERRLEFGSVIRRAITSSQGQELRIEVDGAAHRISRGDAGTVSNLSPAVVVSIPVSVGDSVEAGEVVAVVEAMKMESSLTAPFAGRVTEVLVDENVHVAAQEPLLRIEPLDEQLAEPAADSELSFADSQPAVAPGEEDCQRSLERLRWGLLGYDIDRTEFQRLIVALHDGSTCAPADPVLIAAEDELLRTFADVCGVSRPDPSVDSGEAPQSGSAQEHFHAWLRSPDADAERLPASFLVKLRAALSHFGIDSLERTPGLEEACYRIFLAQQRTSEGRAAILAILDRRLDYAEQLIGTVGAEFREALDRLGAALAGRDQVIADLARELRFRYFDGPVIAAAREPVYDEMERHVAALLADPLRADRAQRIASIVSCSRPLAPRLTHAMSDASPAARLALLEAMTRRYYRVRSLESFRATSLGGRPFVVGRYAHGPQFRHLAAAFVELADVGDVVRAAAAWAQTIPTGELVVLDLYAEHRRPAPPRVELAAQLRRALRGVEPAPALHRVVVAVADRQRGSGMGAVDLFTFRPGPDGLVEDVVVRGLHPMMGQRLKLWRLSEFELERLASAEDVYVFRGTARANPADVRLFALAEVRDLTPARDQQGRVVSLPELEQMIIEALEALRRYQRHLPLNRRLMWNRMFLYVWPVIEFELEEVRPVISRLAPLAGGLGLEAILIDARVREPDGEARERTLRLLAPAGRDVSIQVETPSSEPLRPLDTGTQRLISARRRGLMHPAEVVRLLATAHASVGQRRGTFTEHELDDQGVLFPVARPQASNPSAIVVGTIRNYTTRYPEGMLRVSLLGDPTRALGSLAAAECARIIAAIDLAESLGVPLEWFALSAGAKIAMDSGTETMDWIAAVLRRIVKFTQAGGELNVVVAGINVGAQPYFNAEATMLMHTRGALIMTPDSSMVLTGKQAIDYSGGVSAEDNLGIGGYERIMGPNGQAQYWAPDMAGACWILLRYYERTYVAPGERFPRRASTADPAARDPGLAPHGGFASSLATVRDVFSDATNPGRKQPFDIRSVMRAVIDSDHPPLERWVAMRDAESAVVWDACLGGWPVSVLGIESRPLPRLGQVPADGPERWTAGTLFPRSSKKLARAINAAGGRRPVVVLANLAGFDASPESMREWQLEFGAEIGRAVVNCDGPLVFCVVSHYHGGAFVVFSQLLNPNLETLALEGARASVIGGAPAAAVVFAREVEQAAAADERVVALDRRIADADGRVERQRLRAERDRLWNEVLTQKRGELAGRFDRVHSVERAVEVGSVRRIVKLESFRSELIDAVERGIGRVLERATLEDAVATVDVGQSIAG